MFIPLSQVKVQGWPDFRQSAKFEKNISSQDALFNIVDFNVMISEKQKKVLLMLIDKKYVQFLTRLVSIHLEHCFSI